MKLAILWLLLGAAVPATAAPVQPNPLPARHDEAAQEREVRAAIDAFFAAVESKNREAILASVLGDGLATAIRIGAGQPTIMSWHWPSYAEMVLASSRTWTERLIDPQMRVEPDMAMVWARYELLVDGAFSHCGTNHFDLVRKGGKWLIYNLTWTNRKEGCPGR